MYLQGKKADPTDRSSPMLEPVAQDKNEREHIIMRNFSKVLWNVLKQYNEKLKVISSLFLSFASVYIEQFVIELMYLKL